MIPPRVDYELTGLGRDILRPAPKSPRGHLPTGSRSKPGAAASTGAEERVHPARLACQGFVTTHEEVATVLAQRREASGVSATLLRRPQQSRRSANLKDADRFHAFTSWADQ